MDVHTADVLLFHIKNIRQSDLMTQVSACTIADKRQIHLAATFVTYTFNLYLFSTVGVAMAPENTI